MNSYIQLYFNTLALLNIHTMLLYGRGAILIIVSKIFKYITKRTHKSIQEDNTYRYIAPIYVTVHGKTYVNDLSFKGKNQRTTNECFERFYELPERSIDLDQKI